jgi:hypothetical protein
MNRFQLSRKKGQLIFRSALLLLVFLNLSGCSVKLVPDFSQNIVDQIVSVDQDMMTFFSSVSEGTQHDDFPARQEKYDRIIGSLDALSLQIRARPVPDSKVRNKINDFLNKRGSAPLADSLYPSAEAIENIAKQIRKMKSEDKIKDLTETVIELFKNAVVISADQALTFENFLK